MAFGSELQRQRVIEAVRQAGPDAPWGRSDALDIALASVAFDLAAAVDEEQDRAAVARRAVGDRGSWATGDDQDGTAVRQFVHRALRCSGRLLDLLSDIAAAPLARGEDRTGLVISILSQLPITTLPERELPWNLDHQHRAQRAQRVRHLCPDPMPTYALEAWAYVDRCAKRPPTLVESEEALASYNSAGLSKHHLDDSSVGALAVAAALGVQASYCLDEPVSALLAAGDLPGALELMGELELESFPAGPDVEPTVEDLARFGDPEMLHLLGLRLGYACYERSLVRTFEENNGTVPVHSNTRCVEWPVSASDYRQAAARALEVAGLALRDSLMGGQLRAFADRTTRPGPATDTNDLLTLLRCLHFASEATPNAAEIGGCIGRIKGYLEPDRTDGDLGLLEYMRDDWPWPLDRDDVREECGL